MKIFLFFVLVSLPVHTFAGVFSFVSDLFAQSSGEVDDSPTQNSQNIALLQAVQNSDPNPVKHSPDLMILNDSVLETNIGPDGTEVEIEEKEASDRVSVYEVRSGDTLSGIAEMFGVSPNTILWANDLNSAKNLKIGDKLVILPISGVKYVVSKGDSIKSIAKKFGGDEDEIKRFNDLGDVLVAGTEIIIPDGEIVNAPVSSKVTVKKPKNISSGSSSGYYIKPVVGIKTQGLHGKYSTAVDIGAPVGSTIKASASGKVIVAKVGGWNGGYGNYVVIQHANGTQTLYAHMSTVSVSSGSYINQGEKVGAVGMTGRTTGAHLHFEILGGTRNWNPFN